MYKQIRKDYATLGEMLSALGAGASFVGLGPEVGQLFRGFEERQLGRLIDVNESMSERAAAHQLQTTGTPAGQAYLVNGVRFDAMADGTLLDAKGPGYASFVGANGDFYPWFKGAEALVNQASRQPVSAQGTPVTWIFAEENAASATQTLLESEGIQGINVIYAPTG